jgi:YggT family protein
MEILNLIIELIVYGLMLYFIFNLFKVDYYNPVVMGFTKVITPILNFLSFFPNKLISTIFVAIAFKFLLYGYGNKIGLSYVVLALVAGLDVIRLFFNLILYIVIGGVILSWVAPGSDHPINKLIEEISFKVLMPIRKFIPSMGGLDISPIFVLIFLQQLDYFFYAIRMSLL